MNRYVPMFSCALLAMTFAPAPLFAQIDQADRYARCENNRQQVDLIGNQLSGLKTDEEVARLRTARLAGADYVRQARIQQEQAAASTEDRDGFVEGVLIYVRGFSN